MGVPGSSLPWLCADPALCCSLLHVAFCCWLVTWHSSVLLASVPCVAWSLQNETWQDLRWLVFPWQPYQKLRMLAFLKSSSSSRLLLMSFQVSRSSSFCWPSSGRLLWAFADGKEGSTSESCNNTGTV